MFIHANNGGTMPLTGFEYPDGDIVSLEDVNTGNVDVMRMGIALPTLLHMAKQRDNNRPPSTTELLIGTCQAYLQRKVDYTINPQDNAFALAGTMHHSKLEDSANEVDMGLNAEVALEYEGITGIVDLYDENNKTLIDYKNTGSYKITRLLGIQFKYGKHPTERYKRSGKWGKVGSRKRIKIFYEDPETADFGEWGWQINWYRLLLEKNGYPVDDMYIQATVRDGGIAMARDRGVDKNIYLIKVPYIHNDHLLDKFLTNRDDLVDALRNDSLPDICNDEETWDGRKCEAYCPVRFKCPYIRKERNEE